MIGFEPERVQAQIASYAPHRVEKLKEGKSSNGNS